MTNIIHQVAISNENLEQYVAPNKNNIKQFYGSSEYMFWDYFKIKDFILKNGDVEVLEAIDNIKPNAFKADIARYYIVYKMGGWYVDLNTYFQHHPPVGKNELIVFTQTQFFTSESSWAVYNGLFYFNKEHPILKYMIDRCIENVKNKYYGANPWCPTGPNIFGLAVSHFNLPENNTYLFGSALWNLEDKPDGFYLNDKSPFALYKPSGLYTGDSGLPHGNNYVEMWHDKNIY